MKRILLLHVVFIALACQSAVAQTTTRTLGTTSEPTHLTVAKQFVANLDLGNTDYVHGAPRVKFTIPYESHTDCSGFVDALLAHSYGFDQQVFRNVFGSGRPTAARYHDAILQQKGFHLIEHIQDARPGDFLAAKYLTRTDNTGHIMLVAARPVQIDRPKKPLIAGTIQWEVAIIDSSESGHGPMDTRHKKGVNGKDHDGLGEGILRIYSDGSGNVVGCAWSTLAASKFKSPQDEPLVIGRLAFE
jgi:hypothetical protein